MGAISYFRRVDETFRRENDTTLSLTARCELFLLRPRTISVRSRIPARKYLRRYISFFFFATFSLPIIQVFRIIGFVTVERNYVIWLIIWQIYPQMRREIKMRASRILNEMQMFFFPSIHLRACFLIKISTMRKFMRLARNRIIW